LAAVAEQRLLRGRGRGDSTHRNNNNNNTHTRTHTETQQRKYRPMHDTQSYAAKLIAAAQF
jgi:hypothetical protein